MNVSDTGLKLIQAWEGLGDGDPRTVLLEPYICPAKVWTVGWGTALTTPSGQVIKTTVFGPAKAKQLAAECMQRRFGKQAITKDEAQALLRHDVQGYVTAVNQVADATTHQCEFDAMVAFCFNIGVGGYASSAVRRLHAGGIRKCGDISISGLAQKSKAKAEPTTIPIAFSRWSNANGQWMRGLFRRRVCELLIYAGHDLDTALRLARSYDA